MFANKLISWATGVELHDYGCSLKVFRAEVEKPLRLYGEMHRFIPGHCQPDRRAHRRDGGESSPAPGRQHEYGLSRTIRVLLDLATVKFLLSYSTRPLQIFGLLGLITGSLGGSSPPIWPTSGCSRRKASAIVRCCCWV